MREEIILECKQQTTAMLKEQEKTYRNSMDQYMAQIKKYQDKHTHAIQMATHQMQKDLQENKAQTQLILNTLMTRLPSFRQRL